MDEAAALAKVIKQVEKRDFKVESEIIEGGYYVFTSGPTEDTLTHLQDIQSQIGQGVGFYPSELAGGDDIAKSGQTFKAKKEFRKRLAEQGIIGPDIPVMRLPYEADRSRTDIDRVTLTETALQALDEAFKKAD